jgi:hypothetical protein
MPHQLEPHVQSPAVLLADQSPRYGTGTEIIRLEDPAPGEYVVKVHFFDSYSSTSEIFPRVTVELDGAKQDYARRGTDPGLVDDEAWEVTRFSVQGKEAGKLALRQAHLAPLRRYFLPPKQR